MNPKCMKACVKKNYLSFIRWDFLCSEGCLLSKLEKLASKLSCTINNRPGVTKGILQNGEASWWGVCYQRGYPV